MRGGGWIRTLPTSFDSSAFSRSDLKKLNDLDKNLDETRVGLHPLIGIIDPDRHVPKYEPCMHAQVGATRLLTN